MYLLYMILVAASFLPLGYLILKCFSKGLDAYAFGVLLPIYIVLGLASSSLILFVVALVGMPFRTFVFLTPLISVAIVFLSSKRRLSFHKLNIHTLLKFSESLVPIILLALSMLYFSYIAERMHWAAPGDPASHGTLVSLILCNNEIPHTYTPISNSTLVLWKYPLLFPIISAAASVINDVYPGQAMLTIAALISALIPSILYTLVFLRTKSLIHSLLAYFLAFMVPGLKSALQFRDVLFANLLNGTYPNHMANLLIITFFGIAIVKFGNLKYKVNIEPVLVMLTFAVTLTYYPYAPLILVYFVGVFVTKYRRKHVGKRRLLIGIFGIFCAVALVVFTFHTTLSSLWAQAIESFLSGAEGYRITASDMSFEYLLIIFLAVLLSVLLVMKHDRSARSMLATIALFFIPIILSLNAYTSNYILFLPTRRMQPIVYSLSVIILAISLYYIEKSYQFRINSLKNPKSSKHNLHAMILRISLLSLVALYVATLLYNSNPYPSKWQMPVEDYDALQWIVKNTSPTDLILNDRSFPGLFLTSFRAQSAINELNLIVNTFAQAGPKVPDYPFGNRSLRANAVFDSPGNYDLIRRLLKEYEIQYVFVSSQDLFADFWHPVIGPAEDVEWKSRLEKYCSIENYLALFDENPYLETVFKRGNARVYRVRTDILDIDAIIN